MAEKFLVPTRAGTIRRVIRQGYTYICGLCRNDFREPAEAQDCIQNCWEELLALDPVIQRRPKLGVGKLIYRCRFCARDYESREQAARCAADCRRVHLDRYQAELRLLDSGGEPLPRRYKPKPVLRPVPLPRQPSRPKAKVEPAAAPAPPPQAAPAAPVSTPVTADVEALAAAGGSAGSGAGAGASEAAPKKPKDPANAFYRDGARYVCKVCNEKYFTKDDVLKCFLGHS